MGSRRLRRRPQERLPIPQGIQMFTDRIARSSNRAQGRQSPLGAVNLLLAAPVIENRRNVKHPIRSDRRSGSQRQIIELRLGKFRSQEPNCLDQRSPIND